MTAQRPTNPALWLVIMVPIVAILLGMTTLAVAIATDDAPIQMIDQPLTKTSWRERAGDAP